MRKNLVLVVSLLLVCFVMAQETQEQLEVEIVKPYVPPSEAEITELKPRAPLVLSGGVFENVISLNAKDAELQNVIRGIAKKTGLNILIDPNLVTGTVTMSLENVPVGAALDSILKNSDLGAVVEPGNIVRIVPRRQIQPSEIEATTIHVPINWIPSAQLAEAIKPFLTKEQDVGRIQAHPETNSLIITDTPQNLEVIKDLVARLDRPEKQVMIEARVMDMTEAAQREIGIRWSINREDSAGISQFTRDVMDRTEYTDVIEVADEVVGNFTNFQEVLRNDVPFDMLGVELPRTAEGLQWSIGGVATIFGDEYLLEAQISALEDRDLVTVLANPRVTTINNVPAHIEILSEIPYREAVQGPSGEFITEEVEFKETGLRLTVTPNITDNDYVRMNLEPEHTILRDIVAGVPVVDTRKALLNVITKDEQTIALGGLRQHERGNLNEGVPWMHRIPVLGWLFKWKRNYDTKLDLVIFVTPHIIKDPVLTLEEKEQYNRIDKTWHLPDYMYDDVKQEEEKKHGW